ncbi:MAG TPA: cytochrome bc complex cytochrome b subunit [Solirubrobacteraceae bacterium]|nr:cytochrome bc complex cytochrome b subunit [Solirubrobacteraceae bacterium]
MVRRVVAFLDQRSGSAPLLKKTLRYAFPDHWSFLLGEVALYAFMVLIATGIYLTFFFEPSLAHTVYHGSYAPLRGQKMSLAYKSVVDISFKYKAGLLIRQTHHWAADVFVAAIVLHVVRVFFTGAFRKPRELTWTIGLLMLFTTLLEGYAGYSMVDDLLSGMGLAIGYAVALSIPFVGANLAQLIWGAPYPGTHAFEDRLYIAHVFLLPILIGTLLAVHLALVAARHHTQFKKRERQTEKRLIGVPAFPGQAPRSLGLMLAVAAVLFLMGGLIQINPIWQWGPYEIYKSTNGAQPDWYLGWLIGALRLVPSFDLVIDGYTLVPNPFWGGALFPLIVLGTLLAWPWAERRITKDYAFHNLADRPRDAPRRTAAGMAFFTWIVLIFVAGGADRIYVFFGLSYTGQIWVFRVLIWVLPAIMYFVVKRWCISLQEAERIERSRHEAEEEAQRAQSASVPA